MSTFTKERKSAHINGASGNLTLDAEFSFYPGNRISNFNGVASSNGGGTAASFNYTEDESGKKSITIIGAPDDEAYLAVYSMISSAATEIHTKYDE